MHKGITRKRKRKNNLGEQWLPVRGTNEQPACKQKSRLTNTVKRPLNLLLVCFAFGLWRTIKILLNINKTLLLQRIRRLTIKKNHFRLQRVTLFPIKNTKRRTNNITYCIVDRFKHLHLAKHPCGEYRYRDARIYLTTKREIVTNYFYLQHELLNRFLTNSSLVKFQLYWKRKINSGRLYLTLRTYVRNNFV